MNTFLNTIKSPRFGIAIALLTANREVFNTRNAQVIEYLNREEPSVPGVCWGGGDAVLVQRAWNNQK
jgi:hypothetical protein